MRTFDNLPHFKSSVIKKSVHDGNRLDSLNFDSLHLGAISKPYLDFNLIDGINDFEDFKGLGVSRIGGGHIRHPPSKVEVMSKLSSILKSAYMNAYDKVGVIGKSSKRKRVKSNYLADGESDAEKLMRKCADILTGQHVPSGSQQFGTPQQAASLAGIFDKIEKPDFDTMFVHTVPTHKVVVDADTKQGKFPDFGIFQTLVFPDFGIFQTLVFPDQI